MSTHQLTFWKETEEDCVFNEVKNLRGDVSQLRKSMFARHGEFMKVLADLQGQINELYKENEMEEKKADPELSKFFNNLSALKNNIKERSLNCPHAEVVAELHEIYDRLDAIFRTKEEELQSKQINEKKND